MMARTRQRCRQSIALTFLDGADPGPREPFNQLRDRESRREGPDRVDAPKSPDIRSLRRAVGSASTRPPLSSFFGRPGPDHRPDFRIDRDVPLGIRAIPTTRSSAGFSSGLASAAISRRTSARDIPGASVSPFGRLDPAREPFQFHLDFPLEPLLADDLDGEGGASPGLRKIDPRRPGGPRSAP